MIAATGYFSGIFYIAYLKYKGSKVGFYKYVLLKDFFVAFPMTMMGYVSENAKIYDKHLKTERAASIYTGIYIRHSEEDNFLYRAERYL